MKNKHWFIINGFALAGKDTFKSFVDDYVGIKSISTVDVVKKICLELGWNGLKDDNGRLALSDFKDLSTKHFDHPFKYVENELEKFRNNEDIFIFTVDVREPKDIKRLVDEFGFETIFISNKNIKSVPNNHADIEVENYNYDHIIHNDGTLEDFKKNIIDFIDNLD